MLQMTSSEAKDEHHLLAKAAPMFSLFKKKSPLEKLQAKHAKLMEEAFKISKIDRAASDKLYSEADEVQKEIGKLMD